MEGWGRTLIYHSANRGGGGALIYQLANLTKGHKNSFWPEYKYLRLQSLQDDSVENVSYDQFDNPVYFHPR